MKRILASVALLALGSASIAARADDATPAAGASHQTARQFMKDCMQKARAANNGMSEKDMKKSCKEQWKASMDHPAAPVTPAQ